MARDVFSSRAWRLELELIAALRAESGLSDIAARQFVAPLMRHLTENYGGSFMYVPKGRAQRPSATEIRARIDEAGSVDRACRQLNISRSTGFRILREENKR